jgi:hypothetical protein
MVYVTVPAGETLREPFEGTAPIPAIEAETVLFEVHESVVESPAPIVPGVALIEHEGAGTTTTGDLIGPPWLPPPPPTVPPPPVQQPPVPGVPTSAASAVAGAVPANEGAYTKNPTANVSTARNPMIAENLVIRCIIIFLKVFIIIPTGSLRISSTKCFVSDIQCVLKKISHIL